MICFSTITLSHLDAGSGRRPPHQNCTPIRGQSSEPFDTVELPDQERQLYVRRRLTELDKALSDDEAVALEGWLDCEEMLQGRVRTIDWDGGSGGDGFRRASQAPNWAMEMLADHAAAKRALTARDRKALAMLGQMMEAPQWDLSQAGYALFGAHVGYTPAKKRFIEAVRAAAAALAAAARRPPAGAGGGSSDGMRLKKQA